MSERVIDFQDRRWKDSLQINGNGVVRANLFNACHALRKSPEFAGLLQYDEMSMQTVATKPTPWDRECPRPWRNFDDSAATEWLQSQDIQIGREITQQAVEKVAGERPYHPLRDWLSSLQWDETPRVDDWLTFHLGAARSPYVQAVGAAWMISAVARIFQPGCKADHIMILEGKQGIRKSTALKTLAGAEWFTDEMADFGSKDAAMQMRGVWIIELAELDHLSRSEASRIKAFMSRSTDRFRPPYGARLVEAPRECVFAGTVNDDEYLKDSTGNRRFWPIRVGASIDIEGLASEREQLWAEAVHRYRQGEPWWLTDSGTEKQANREQRERVEIDPWEPLILDWMARQNDEFSTTEILLRCIEKHRKDVGRADQMRVSKILKQNGFVRQQKRFGGAVAHVWIMSESSND